MTLVWFGLGDDAKIIVRQDLCVACNRTIDPGSLSIFLACAGDQSNKCCKSDHDMYTYRYIQTSSSGVKTSEDTYRYSCRIHAYIEINTYIQYTWAAIATNSPLVSRNPQMKPGNDVPIYGTCAALKNRLGF
jgi:hypothetical protein